MPIFHPNNLFASAGKWCKLGGTLTWFWGDHFLGVVKLKARQEHCVDD